MRTLRLCPLPTPALANGKKNSQQLTSFLILFYCDGRPMCGCEKKNSVSDKNIAILFAKKKCLDFEDTHFFNFISKWENAKASHSPELQRKSE